MSTVATTSTSGSPKTAAVAAREPAAVWLGRFRLVLDLVVLMLVWSFGLRVVLTGVYVGWTKLTAAEWLSISVAGLRFDVLISLLAVTLQMLHLTLTSQGQIRAAWSRWFHESLWTFSLAFLPLLCVAEYLFFGEFDSRLNYIAFEYLVYPTEVCCNIQQSYPVGWLLLGVGLAAGTMIFLLRPRLHVALASTTSRGARYGVPLVWAVALVCLLSTTRVKDSEVTEDRVANQCAMNGAYSFGYHAWTCRFEFDRLYLTIDKKLAHDRIRKRISRQADTFVGDSDNPIDRTVSSGEAERPWNVVLILEESLGSDYVEAAGGKKGLTPNFSELCHEGLLFENFFATGNRTARALEAVLTSLPPIPTESILKRDKSNHVYTLANVLEQRGYERLFMTGGNGTFDGVRPFMTANGFNRFCEQSDYVDPSFINAWGVADEDLFRRGLDEMDQMATTGKPFFNVMLTVSNHRPFTYPDGRIDRPSSDQTRDNAVKYADWALGWFFTQARKKSWYQNTLFVVMGDHGARVYGRQQFPMKSYRVPALMIFPDKSHAGERSSTLACSLDVAPTVMGALGGEYKSVFFGRDARAIRPEEGYALMQHNHEVALLSADHKMTVLGSGRRHWEFELDPATFELTTRTASSRDGVLDTIAFFQSAYQLYYDEECYPHELQARLATPAKPASGIFGWMSREMPSASRVSPRTAGAHRMTLAP